jgi:hypothetical protein
MIEDVHALSARIAETSGFLSHLAPRYAALAIHAIETEMVKDTREMTEIPLSLTYLRKIANIAKSANSEDAFETAVKTNDVVLVKLLLELEDFGALDRAIEIACAHGHTEVARFLLEHHSVNNLLRALVVACEGGHTAIVRLLLEHGVDVRAYRDLALRIAVYMQHREIIQLLRERGSEIDVHVELLILRLKGNESIMRAKQMDPQLLLALLF